MVGNRCFPQGLVQGGMEIPCKYTFKGQPKEVDKVHKFLCGALNEMQVIISNSDDQVCNSVPVPCTVSTSAESSIYKLRSML